MNTKSLGLLGTDVGTEEGALGAIDDFGYALFLVNGVRSYYCEMLAI